MCLRQFLNLNSLLNSSHSCMSLTTSHRGVSRTSKSALTLRDSRQSIVADISHLPILLRCALEQLCPSATNSPIEIIENP